MSPLNPYEPPLLPAEVPEPQWPAGGAYSDGQYLVLHHASSLPPICVKSGQPAELEQDYELIGGLPNDGSVPATRERWLGDKIYAIRLPLTRRVVWRAKLMNAAGVSLGVLMFGVLIIWACFQPRLSPSISGEAVLVSALVGLIISVALLTEGRHQLQLECVARGFFWISKVPKRYLQQLPPWPVPRPSFWRRAFFGPAGVSPAKPADIPPKPSDITVDQS
jgi:hypothetical protein